MFQFPPQSTSAFALPGEIRQAYLIRVKMNEKTSINSIYPNLWAPTTSLLQGLTVVQQCVYHKKFRNVCEVKKRLVQPGLVWSRTYVIDTAVNEWRKHLFACVRIVGQHFKQFYCRQLKNGQLNEMSATMSEM